MNTDLAAQHALDHLSMHGPDGLSEFEKTLAAVWLFDAGGSNSGFAQYFASSRGDLGISCPAWERRSTYPASTFTAAGSIRTVS